MHEIDKPNSKFIEAVSNGWPAIISSLKSLLETGESLEATRAILAGGPRFTATAHEYWASWSLDISAMMNYGFCHLTSLEMER